MTSLLHSLALRIFSVEQGDVAGLQLSAGAALCMMCSYFYLQPLSDALALQVGIRLTPLITVANIGVIVVMNALYGMLVQRQPVTTVLYTVYCIVIAFLLLFALLFTTFPTVLPPPPMPPPTPPQAPLAAPESVTEILPPAEPLPWTHLPSLLSFIFCVFTGTISLFLTTTFWGRMASLHTKEEAKRVYGVIAAGAQVVQPLPSSLRPPSHSLPSIQVGQLTASVSASVLFSIFDKRIVIWSALLLVVAILLVSLRGSLRTLASIDEMTPEQKAQPNKDPERSGQTPNSNG